MRNFICRLVYIRFLPTVILTLECNASVISFDDWSASGSLARSSQARTESRLIEPQLDSQGGTASVRASHRTDGKRAAGAPVSTFYRGITLEFLF